MTSKDLLPSIIEEEKKSVSKSERISEENFDSYKENDRPANQQEGVAYDEQIYSDKRVVESEISERESLKKDSKNIIFIQIFHNFTQLIKFHRLRR